MKRRILLLLAGLLAAASIAGYALWFLPLRDAVGIGTSMLAKQMCSCMFVAGRSYASCRQDQFPSMDPIQVEVLSQPNGIRAFVELLGERSAVWREGIGCTLD